MLMRLTTAQRGKLLTHSVDTEAELDLLHPADRLMVRLIQLPHLSDRVKGMLFQVGFSQNLDLLQQVGGSLQGAPQLTNNLLRVWIFSSKRARVYATRSYSGNCSISF